MTRTNPNWLTCQINGVADYICNCPGSNAVLRTLAGDFHRAAERIEKEIIRRESTGRDYTNDGVFG
jgi:hypothetical protein